MRCLYEFAVLSLVITSVLYGFVILLADSGRPRVGYTDKDRQQLNWLVMHSTRNIHDKFQGRLNK